jgi:hypothetical protein
MITYTELDNRLVGGGPFTIKELMGYTQGLQALLIEEGFNIIPSQPYPSLVRQVLYVSMGPGRDDMMRITITSTTGSSTRGGWVDAYCWPGVPKIVAGVMGDKTPMTSLLASMHMVKGWIQMKAYCGGCYYYSNAGTVNLDVGNSGYCGTGRPMVSGGCGGYIGRTQL